jgi:hypothetical protein
MVLKLSQSIALVMPLLQVLQLILAMAVFQMLFIALAKKLFTVMDLLFGMHKTFVQVVIL